MKMKITGISGSRIAYHQVGYPSWITGYLHPRYHKETKQKKLRRECYYLLFWLHIFFIPAISRQRKTLKVFKIVIHFESSK